MLPDKIERKTVREIEETELKIHSDPKLGKRYSSSYNVVEEFVNKFM